MDKYYYLLMYDIGEDKRRTRLQKKLLKKEWCMLQYSVYIKYTNMVDITAMLPKLTPLVKEQEHDSLFYTRVHLSTLIDSPFASKLGQYLSEEIEQVFL
ncbi:CRISPR-associated endonuclease Cas2 [Spirosomataceae bacterium TFI 002]|nr:CRISPR-associated endonuclease Cas2 [Spirosomataceae bacterium TFI 002]